MSNTPADRMGDALEAQNKALERIAQLSVISTDQLAELKAALQADDRTRFERALTSLQATMTTLSVAQREVLATGMALLQSATDVEQDAMHSMLQTWGEGYEAGYEQGARLAADAERAAYTGEGYDWFEFEGE